MTLLYDSPLCGDGRTGLIQPGTNVLSPAVILNIQDVRVRRFSKSLHGTERCAGEESVESESSTTEWLPMMLEEYLYTKL